MSAPLQNGLKTPEIPPGSHVFTHSSLRSEINGLSGQLMGGSGAGAGDGNPIGEIRMTNGHYGPGGNIVIAGELIEGRNRVLKRRMKQMFKVRDKEGGSNA